MAHMWCMKNSQYVILLIMLIICASLAAGCTSSASSGTANPLTPAPAVTQEKTQENLLVYSGAGLKKPMQEIGTAFTDKYGVSVQYTFGGSGMLISQMTLTHKGDVFVPGSTVEFNLAKNQGLVDTSQLVAYHVPVIAVQKGNPKGISTLEDFATPGLKVALGDANATAIGKAGTKMFTKFDIVETVEENVITRTPTINELTVIMNTGQADAAILTLDQIDPDKVDTLTIPVEDNVILVIPVGVTTFSANPETAQKFADFVASEDGKAIFAKHGFPSYPDPAYASISP